VDFKFITWKNVIDLIYVIINIIKLQKIRIFIN